MNIWIILVICLLINLFIFIYFKWLVKRRTSASGLLAEYKKEVERLIADIDDATDRDSLLVEDRIRKLKQILDETDKRIAVYLRELDKSRSGETLYSDLRRGIGAALKEGATAPDVIEISPRPAPVLAADFPVPEPQTQIPPAPPPPPATPRPAPAAPAEGVEKPPAKLRLRDQIEEFFNEGFTAEQIASRLGRSIAEVELAINLLEKKSQAQ